MLNSSCMNPIQGVPIASEEVMPAKKRSPNQNTPARVARNGPQFSNKNGMVWNAIPKLAFSFTQSSPR